MAHALLLLVAATAVAAVAAGVVAVGPRKRDMHLAGAGSPLQWGNMAELLAGKHSGTANALSFVAIDAVEPEPSTMLVDGSRATDSSKNVYQTIQEAVNASKRGDIIEIKPHPSKQGYNENVTIKTSGITLRGRGDAASFDFSGEYKCPRTVLDGCGTPDAPAGCNTAVISIDASHVTLENLTVRFGRVKELFPSSAEGVTLRGSCFVSEGAQADFDFSTHVSIEANLFAGERDGSPLSVGANGSVAGNVIVNSEDGIEFGPSSVIENNTILGVYSDDAIKGTCSGSGATVHNNVIMDVDGGDGINLNGAPDSDITANIVLGVTDTGIINTGLGVEGGQTGFPPSSPKGNGGTISGNYIRMTGDIGVQVGQFSNADVTNNWTSFTTDNAIEMLNCRKCTLTENTTWNSGWLSNSDGRQPSILVTGSDDTTVTGNETSFSGGAGLYVQNSVDLTIDGNQSHGDGSGIVLDQMSGSSLSNNIVTDSAGPGFAFFPHSSPASFGANTSVSNRVGLCHEDAFTFHNVQQVSDNNSVSDVDNFCIPEKQVSAPEVSSSICGSGSVTKVIGPTGSPI